MRRFLTLLGALTLLAVAAANIYPFWAEYKCRQGDLERCPPSILDEGGE